MVSILEAIDKKGEFLYYRGACIKGVKILRHIFAISSLALITFSASFLNQNPKSGLVKGVSVALEKSSPRQEIYFGRPTLSYDEMLKQNQVVVYPEDIVSTFPDPSLNLGSRIVINRAYKVIVNDADRQDIYRTWQKDVAGFLSEKGIQVGADDIVNAKLDQAISDNLSLQITRVSQNEITETIPIPYETIKKNDPNLLAGKTETEQAGQEGIREKRYKIRRENGQITEKILLEDKLIKDSQDKIVKVGTKILVLSTQEGECSWLKGVTSSVKYRKGTLIKVTNKANGKSVKVTVGGWGPQPSTGRVLDLNFDAFSQIANPDVGHINVLVEEINE